jgi:hypothetical protein
MDSIESDHLELVIEECDTNGNNQLDECEIHACIVKCENAWREESCPEFGNAYCDCYIDVVVCPGAWECEDIDTVVLDFMAYYDTDINGSINPADAIDAEHYGLMIDSCDTNFDGSIDSCEVHACTL